MKERPILFSGAMVRALLAGTKTQTRRVINLPHMNPLGQWEPVAWGGPHGGRPPEGKTAPAQVLIGHSRTGEILGCPYGQPGDHMWVREAFGCVPTACESDELVYAADYQDGSDRATGVRYRPSIHMPRWASRITLEVTGVRVERLQDISDGDARAEGVQMPDGTPTPPEWWNYRQEFAHLWDQINGPGSWDANPWVWVVKFRRIQS
jgi:hypothetical protein